MLTFLCPYCSTEIPGEAQEITSLPPTDADYEWQEGIKMHSCPNCQNTSNVRVRTSIETGGLLFINNSPKPIADIVWYAVGIVEDSSWEDSPDEKSVRALAVCQTEAEAKAKLLEHSGQHSQTLHLLRLTSKGYFDAQGNQIKEWSVYEDVINYLEIQ